jgi:hypothetical protein
MKSFKSMSDEQLKNTLLQNVIEPKKLEYNLEESIIVKEESLKDSKSIRNMRDS